MNLHRCTEDDFDEPHMEEDQTDPLTLREIVSDIAPAVLITLGAVAFVLLVPRFWS